MSDDIVEERYWHFRHLEFDIDAGEWVHALKGGCTICLIRTDTGSEHWGTSVCTLDDQFSKPKGRLISRGRAMKAMHASSMICSPHIRPAFIERNRYTTFQITRALEECMEEINSGSGREAASR